MFKDQYFRAVADIEYIDGKEPKDIWAEIYYQKELEWGLVWVQCSTSEKPFWVHPRRSQTPPGKF
jgi:hypothetical protein|tara:strand:+ start:1524 stop:1718 length:195 start_codon:yes stop_codon:yes gene_type:complete